LACLFDVSGVNEEHIDLYRTIDMTFWLPQAAAVLAQVACYTRNSPLWEWAMMRMALVVCMFWSSYYGIPALYPQ
jgi:hypothetical protein